MKGKAIEIEIFCSFIDSPKRPATHRLPRPKPGALNASRIFHVGGRDPATLCCSLAAVRGSCMGGVSAVTPTCEVSIPRREG